MIDLVFMIECHPTCLRSCKWDTCCVQIGCRDSCGHTYFCSQFQIVSAKTIRCTILRGNGPLSDTTNITFESSINCRKCNYNIMMCNCASASNGLVPVSSCYNVSTYSAHITGPTSTGVTTPVSSSVMGTHHIASPSSSTSVPVTTTITSIVVPAVVGTALLLCLMVAAVFGSILALILCKTKRKQFPWPVTNNSDQISQQRYNTL